MFSLSAVGEQFVDAVPAANAAVLCSNPNFSTLSCQARFDNRYTNDYVVTCSNAGILDALTASIVASTPVGTRSWGQGLSLAQAFAVAGPFGCYDATPLQNANLYSITHQFCPTLDGGISYTTNTAVELNPASWSTLSISVACCARQSQTILTGDSGEECDAQACFQSPQCGEVLRDHCSQTANQRDVFCTRWKSWTTNGMIGVPQNTCVSPGWISAGYPISGTFPSAMDQAMFSLLDYCTANSVTDTDLCAGLSFAPALNNNVLFPRMDAVNISDIVPQYSSSNTVNTVTFSITNVSSRFLRSVTTLQAGSNYTVTIQNPSLYPSSRTAVTVSTAQTAVSAEEVYVISNTVTWVGDSFNVEDQCEAVGTFFPSQLPASISSPQNIDFPTVNACAAGDEQVSLQFFDAGTTTTSFPPALDSTTCGTLLMMHTDSLGATVFPSCSCTSAFGCSGGLEGGCNSSTIVSRQLSSVRVCSTQGYQSTPIFFMDSITYLTNVVSPFRQDFPLFGGFQAAFTVNPFNFFLTPTLLVFPLTSDEALV
jgi:hypothetical protein